MLRDQLLERPHMFTLLQTFTIVWELVERQVHEVSSQCRSGGAHGGPEDRSGGRSRVAPLREKIRRSRANVDRFRGDVGRIRATPVDSGPMLVYEFPCTRPDGPVSDQVGSSSGQTWWKSAPEEGGGSGDETSKKYLKTILLASAMVQNWSHFGRSWQPPPENHSNMLWANLFE